MPNKIRAYWCADCGRWTVRKRKSNDPHICPECGQDRMRAGWHEARRRRKLARDAEIPPPTCTR